MVLAVGGGRSRTKAPSPTASGSCRGSAPRLPAARRQPARLGDRPEAGERPRRRLGLRGARPTSCARSPSSSPTTAASPTPSSKRPACRCRARAATADGTPILLRRRLRSRQGPVRPGRRRRLRSRPATAAVRPADRLGARSITPPACAPGVRPGSTNLVPEARLEINPADAARLGVADGDMVRVRPRRAASSKWRRRSPTACPAGSVFLPGFSADGAGRRAC